MVEQRFCIVCQNPLPTRANPDQGGRPRQTCSDGCRQKAYRQRQGRRRRDRDDQRFLANGRKQLRAYEKRFGKLEPRVAFRISHLMPFLTCPICHRPYIKLAWGGFAPTGCSPECVATRETFVREAQRAERRAERQGRPDHAARINRLMERRLPFRVCDHCKEPFLPTGLRGPTARFCSATCRKKNWEMRRRPCPVCGAQFDRRNRQGRLRKKYCTKACYLRARSWRVADRKGKAIQDGSWHYGYGRGAPRTKRILRSYERDEPMVEIEEQGEVWYRF